MCSIHGKSYQEIESNRSSRIDPSCCHCQCIACEEIPNVTENATKKPVKKTTMKRREASKSKAMRLKDIII